MMAHIRAQCFQSLLEFQRACPKAQALLGGLLQARQYQNGSMLDCPLAFCDVERCNGFWQASGIPGLTDPATTTIAFPIGAPATPAGSAGLRDAAPAADAMSWQAVPIISHPSQSNPMKHPSLAKPEHKHSDARRRGPMDEMR